MVHELLKQNGMEPGRLSEEEQKKLHRMVHLEKRRITRMKWATAISWILLALVFLLGRVLESSGLVQSLSSVSGSKVPPTPYLPVLAYFLLWIAIICTVSLAIRLYRLRGFRQQQILYTLARIEEHLKHLDEKK